MLTSKSGVDVMKDDGMSGARELAMLSEKIRTRRALVGVCGLGYVGLPLVQAAGHAGYPVLGFDVDEAKIAQLKQAQSYIPAVSSDVLVQMAAENRFDATADPTDLEQCDVILICVPTPLSEHQSPDLSYVKETARTIARHGRAGQLIVLESTTYPGTTQEVIAPIFVSQGRAIGVDTFLAYSPEREDPGNEEFGTARIPKVVGADDPASAELAEAFYRNVVTQIVPVSSSDTAEAVKLTENIFRAVNIALVNELKVIYAEMGIDIWEVIESAKTKPFGYMPFYPGPGLGGHCIPIDPFYLTWRAREFGVATRFIELAGEINTAMPRHVVWRLAEVLNKESARALNGARVLVLGLSYKKNVADVRESPTFKLLELLAESGADISYHDPLVPTVPHMREYPQFEGMESVDLTAATLARQEAVLIATDHDATDYKIVSDHAKIIIDTRNVMRRNSLPTHNVFQA